MTSKYFGVLAALPMLAFASVASADEVKPITLDAQALDGVTAAGSAFALADAGAMGGLVAATLAATFATVEVVDTFDTEAGGLSLIFSNSAAQAVSATVLPTNGNS